MTNDSHLNRGVSLKAWAMQHHRQALCAVIINDERGITAIETAIILLAFVTVATTFAFTILSAGIFSTEASKAAIFADLAQVQSSMEIKGGVLAVAAQAGVTETIDALVFTVANAVGGQPINLDPVRGGMVIDYRDERQSVPITTWTVRWKVRFDQDDLLNQRELAEITVPLNPTLPSPLGVNTDFVLEIKPLTGSVLTIGRTTPAHIEQVYDLQ